MYIESPLRQGTVEAFVAFTCSDDDMRLAVHEAAGLVRPDFAHGECGGVGGG